MVQHGAAFDLVVSRAFASLQDYVKSISSLCDSRTKIVAMKGRAEQVMHEQLELPAAFKITCIEPVVVPELNAERCVVFLTKQGD